MKKFIIPVLILLNVSALAGIYYYFNNKTQNPVMQVDKASVTPETETPMVTLPDDAVKVSECIPFMGEHWVQPSKLPLGPYYVVYKGKVTALEYMFTPDKIPGEKGAKMSEAEAMDFMKKNNLTLADLVKTFDLHLPLQNQKYQFLSIEWNAPHSGITTPHIDTHAYLISEEETKLICPDATIESVYSQEVMDNVKKYKIPFPGEPAKK
jgi:hypothetical protein